MFSLRLSDDVDPSVTIGGYTFHLDPHRLPFISSLQLPAISTTDVVQCTADYLDQDSWSKHHGWTPLTTVLSIVLVTTALIAIRKTIQQLFKAFGSSKSGLASWNAMSAIVALVISGFGSALTIGIIIDYFWDLCQGMPMCMAIDDRWNISSYSSTSVMINAMDYREYSSRAMVYSVLLVSYFLCDIMTNVVTPVMVFHHTMGIFWIGYYYYASTYTFYILALFATEASTIFLALSQLFPRDSKIKTILLVVFAIVFFICRIVLIPVLMMITLSVEPSHRLYAPLGSMIGLLVLNAYWFVLIARKIKIRLSSRPRSAQN